MAIYTEEALNNATVQPAGPRSGSSGKAFFNVEGSGNGSFASFGVADFNITTAELGLATLADITGLSIQLVQSNASFTTDGLFSIWLTEATAESIEPGSAVTYQSGNDGAASVDPLLTPLFSLGQFAFTEASTGSVETFDLLAGLDDAEEAILIAAITAGSNIRLVITPDDATTAATWAGYTNTTYAGPTLTIEASDVVIPDGFTADFAAFTGTGFAPEPVAGQLDSDAWIVNGLSDGGMTFGETRTTGDFARGAADGGVSTGGVYAFNTGGNVIFGLQPTGDDFTPGDIVLRLQNDGDAALTDIDVAYDIFFRNDQPRANALTFSYSLDGTTYLDVPGLTFTTPEVADGLGWQQVARSVTLSGFTLDPDGLFYLKWSGNDVTGSGSRDEYGIDNVFVSDLAPAAAPPPVAEFKFIHQVQGSGAASPLVGQPVIIEGVVVGDFDDAGQLGGFFIQEEDADADGDANTSEGIFVFTGGFGPNVAEGDVVRLTGTVGESFGRTEINSVTELSILGTDALPTSATIVLPLESVDLEAFEGMRVTVITSTDDPLTVTENFNLDRFGEIAVSAGRKDQPTQVFDPQDEAAEVQALIEANALNRLVVDDDNNNSNPNNDPYVLIPPDGLAKGDAVAADGPTLRVGAELNTLDGVLDFGFGAYRVRVNEALDVDETTNSGARPQQAPAVGGALTVASFNVLNYFNGDGLGGGFPTDRGATTPEDLARQTEKLVNALVEIRADVFGFQEIENDGFAETSALAQLVAALNAELGADVYAFVNAGVPAVGDDAITTALIYDQTSVRLAPGSSVEFLDDSDLPALGLDFGVPVFEGIQRPPLAASFQDLATGETLTVVVNHFKSKGSPTDIPDDADQGDGQGNSNASRVRAAESLVTWLATDPTGSGDDDVLIIGDLNSYAKEDPVAVIKDAGFDDLANDVFGDAADNYSYVFSGADGTLDHVLASSTLTEQATGSAEWHINADEPDLLNYSSEFNEPEFFNADDPFAASDHDPALVGLALGGTFDEIVGSDGNNALKGGSGRDSLSGNGGNDTICSLSGDDRIDGGTGNDRLKSGSGNDNVLGGDGKDTLAGGSGNDRLDGGAANDRISTGSGADLVVLRQGDGSDIVSDFTVGEDAILLDGLSSGDIAISAALGGTAIVADGETLAILLGVAPGELGPEDFLSTVADVLL